MIPKDYLILIKGTRIYSENQIIENGYIKIKGQKIMELGKLVDLINENDFKIMEAPFHFTAIPGFIDVDIHGVNGTDTMDATIEALDTMS